MNPISEAKFSDDYQKFVLQQQPNVDLIKNHIPPEKKFTLEEAKKKKKEEKDKKKKQEDKEQEDSPWIPKPPKNKST